MPRSKIYTFDIYFVKTKNVWTPLEQSRLITPPLLSSSDALLGHRSYRPPHRCHFIIISVILVINIFMSIIIFIIVSG